MWASLHDNLKVVRTLLEGRGDVNAKSNVRNKMMMMIMLMMIIAMMMVII